MSKFIQLFSFSMALLVVCEMAWAQPMCVIRPKVNLRKGPGLSYPVSWTVGQYMPLYKVGAKGGWIQVEDVDGEKHWITSSAVSSKIACAVVRTRTAPLRRGPGSSFPSADLSKVDRYTPFKKIDRDGAWVRLEDEYRATYWVHESKIWIPMIRSRMSF